MSSKTPVHACILGDSDVRVWRLTGRERLERSLARLANVEVIADPEDLPAEATLLVLRGDRIYDARVLAALTDGQEPLVLLDSEGEPSAVRGSSRRWSEVRAALAEGGGPPAGLPQRTPESLVTDSRTSLKSLAVPRVEAIRAENRRQLERWLFSGSYKGVTDLVTKWLWPWPARWATGACLRLGVNPNAVTLMSLILAILATLAFWQGAYLTGLVAAWLMTFLDTLDGKLARVSIESSRFGDRLDHGLDLVHPPFWYLAWGLGLDGGWPLTPDFPTTIAVIFAAYIGGRLCEGAFQLLAPFSLFVWRPFDSVNRLITARRNPNLLLLTGGLIAGRPDIGLWLVALWHLVSTGILLLRLLGAAWQRLRRGRLDSWLDQVDPTRDRGRLMVRLFTQTPPR